MAVYSVILDYKYIFSYGSIPDNDFDDVFQVRI